MVAFRDVAEIPTSVEDAYIYEEGWQTASPASLYPATTTSPRPASDAERFYEFRPGRLAPARGFQGEGLLAVVPADGPGRLYAADVSTSEVPSIRARAEDDRIVISSDGKIVEATFDGRLVDALAGWAQETARRAGVTFITTIGPGWCSWYGYWQRVTEADILENVAVIHDLQLPIEIIQLDDGYQAATGDWLETSESFGSLADLADRVVSAGYRAGIWTAPFWVAIGSRLARDHPDWLVADAALPDDVGRPMLALDVTHPGAAEYLETVYRSLVAMGFDFFKIDFLAVGAVDGRRHEAVSALDAYRAGLRIVRQAVGSSTILGAGPLLPSIGFVDAMRVSPDVDTKLGLDPDLSRQAMARAIMVGRARSWMHGRLWVNDPDCLLARPGVEPGKSWAEHVAACHGIAFSGDRLGELDEDGIELTRHVLRRSTSVPVAWDPFSAAGRLALTSLGHKAGW